MQDPRINSKEPLENKESRWIGLYKLEYSDPKGNKRFWEIAERKTRGSSELDGLVDREETPEKAALRELEEETGYHGKIVSSYYTMYSNVGMTNTNNKLIFVEVDLDDEINKNPQQKLEEDEFITIVIVPIKNLFSTLQEYEKKGYGIDSNLGSFALGLHMSASLLQ
ncbi:NUDIX hydrolase domain-like protein [Rhizophagus irregularis DAOM 181602=DAOM 197198]|uniref:NUDIX hydrolase domain-like protein n=1 Tax=Rhizophagus irregularis (strain DAOM 181602 / DAOM 197198 / MUCL 43194) TaxID=747089 RepID=A0A2P4PY58_RHIID|nr:NUDIX hydrolase domain-like protein [Rhizophagus irregularis DAOM 181602=DAOM 197198]POG70314.1 NUDIX hydrolase domain-like protein [Rhizophagus irregularis DAOM 181602=DAOM 197198]|eukprot:XP_025177180.1 NUDIX hydrolase domain-like protein [Rhizophagus irregularis DAOM 181602=DAOM 197198]